LVLAACFSLRHIHRESRPCLEEVWFPLINSLKAHLLSILAMMRSAIEIVSAMLDSKNGEGCPSQFASFRAAKIEAAISNTRFRPSSTSAV